MNQCGENNDVCFWDNIDPTDAMCWPKVPCEAFDNKDELCAVTAYCVYDKATDICRVSCFDAGATCGDRSDYFEHEGQCFPRSTCNAYEDRSTCEAADCHFLDDDTGALCVPKCENLESSAMCHERQDCVQVDDSCMVQCSGAGATCGDRSDCFQHEGDCQPREACETYDDNAMQCRAAGCVVSANSGCSPRCSTLTTEASCDVRTTDCVWRRNTCHTIQCDTIPEFSACRAAGCGWSSVDSTPQCHICSELQTEAACMEAQTGCFFAEGVCQSCLDLEDPLSCSAEDRCTWGHGLCEFKDDCSHDEDVDACMQSNNGCDYSQDTCFPCLGLTQSICTSFENCFWDDARLTDDFKCSSCGVHTTEEACSGFGACLWHDDRCVVLETCLSLDGLRDACAGSNAGCGYDDNTDSCVSCDALEKDACELSYGCGFHEASNECKQCHQIDNIHSCNGYDCCVWSSFDNTCGVSELGCAPSPTFSPTMYPTIDCTTIGKDENACTQQRGCRWLPDIDAAPNGECGNCGRHHENQHDCDQLHMCAYVDNRCIGHTCDDLSDSVHSCAHQAPYCIWTGTPETGTCHHVANPPTPVEPPSTSAPVEPPTIETLTTNSATPAITTTVTDTTTATSVTSSTQRRQNHPACDKTDANNNVYCDDGIPIPRHLIVVKCGTPPMRA